MLEQTLRVSSIRSQSPKGFGGCIFTGKPIDDYGNVQDAAAYCVVKATGPTLGQTTGVSSPGSGGRYPARP